MVCNRLDDGRGGEGNTTKCTVGGVVSCKVTGDYGRSTPLCSRRAMAGNGSSPGPRQTVKIEGREERRGEKAGR